VDETKGTRKKSSPEGQLYDRPPTGKANLVPPELLLVVCIPDICVDIVVVKDRTQAWIRVDTSALHR
jgi:hypothetical protein